jgi:hypothetical protein
MSLSRRSPFAYRGCLNIRHRKRKLVFFLRLSSQLS